MNREFEDRLLNFCVNQKSDFDSDAWAMFDAPDPDEMAATALFLAAVDWYGHEDELCRVAEQLHPGCIGHLAALIKATRFDCGRFSNMLRMRLKHAATVP